MAIPMGYGMAYVDTNLASNVHSKDYEYSLAKPHK